MAEKEWSKKFTAFKEFKDAVYADPANQAGGTHKSKDGTKDLPNLNYSVYDFKDRKDKEGKNDGAEFVIGKNGGEMLKVVLAESGKLRGVEYVDWTGVEKGGLPKDSQWIGKDFDKLSSVVKDPALKDLAGKLDWTKAPAKEAEAEEIDR